MGPAAPVDARVAANSAGTNGERGESNSRSRVLHTGIEKSCEDKTYSQAITLTDRMDYLNPLGIIWCIAWRRKTSGLEIPKRAQYNPRDEVSCNGFLRIWSGWDSRDRSRAMSVFLYCFREREEILKIFEMFAARG